MKYNEIDESIKKELKRDWIITNGIGGFCSQSAMPSPLGECPKY